MKLSRSYNIYYSNIRMHNFYKHTGQKPSAVHNHTASALPGCSPYVSMVTLDGCGNVAKLAEQIHQAGKQTAYALPHVLRETSEQLLEKGMDWKQFDRIWVRSYDGIGFAKDTLGIPVEKLALDAGLYVFSREASADFLAEGFVGYTASMELNHKELTHMENSQAELMLYGYAPLMVSAQCVYKNYASCILL